LGQKNGPVLAENLNKFLKFSRQSVKMDIQRKMDNAGMAFVIERARSSAVT
jgi:hypothetical protein